MLFLYLLSSFEVLLPTTAIKDHGIVFPKIIEGRGNNQQKILRMNNDITLTLIKSQIFADDFLFISKEGEQETHYYMKHEDYEKNLYHDDKYKASLLVETRDGVKVEGILSDTLRVKPMLEMARSETGEIPHHLYEIDPLGGHEPEHKDYKVANITEGNLNGRILVEGRTSRSTLYPEIHVVVDKAHARAFGYDIAKITLYLAVFFNSCNMRYRRLSRPRIQLRLVGITMLRKDMPFMIRPQGYRQGYIFDEQTLDAFYKYYLQKEEHKNSDLMFLITGEEIIFEDNGVLQTWTAGYTYVGGMCQDQRAGMSEDLPTGYYGVYVATHEIAHSLGCVHDGTEAIKDIPGHTGALQCPWKDGFIMSYVKTNRNQYKFSPCCKKDIRNLVSHKEWRCLTTRVKPSIKESGLPGRYTSGENYCKSCYPSDPQMRYNKERGVRNCTVECTGTETHLLTVPDGTPCDQKREGTLQCLLGKCLKAE